MILRHCGTIYIVIHNSKPFLEDFWNLLTTGFLLGQAPGNWRVVKMILLAWLDHLVESRNNNEDQNAPIAVNQGATNSNMQQLTSSPDEE